MHMRNTHRLILAKKIDHIGKNSAFRCPDSFKRRKRIHILLLQAKRRNQPVIIELVFRHILVRNLHHRRLRYF